jgi:cytochrome c553
MARLVSLAALASAAIFAGAASGRAAEAPPAYAFVVPPPDFKPKPDDGVPRRVPDSDAAYSWTSLLSDRFVAPDWHPQDHPPMPPVVAEGRRPDVFACGFCHRANGSGGPENASLAGLPASYIVQQMDDFKSGARLSSVPKRGPVALMVSLSKATTDAEIAAAASYFSALKPQPLFRVVETDTVPKTIIASTFLADAKTGETEPLGQRLVEIPESQDQFEDRDSRARFIAYAPPGSVAEGEALVTTGGGKTTSCVTCHGPELKGIGVIPGLAGRSPSYLIRQLYDFKAGVRDGDNAALMQPVVANLGEDEMIAIAAYLASQKP